MLFILLCIFAYCKEAYQKSLYGRPGTDEVIMDQEEGFEVLQEGLPKPKLKHVSEGHFTDTKIPDDQYPWPGHKFTCPYNLLKTENQAILKKYNRADMTQDELYWHPAAAKHYLTTDQKLADAKRVKFKYTYNNMVNRHNPPVFMPPGEVVTIEIPKEAVGLLSVTLNRHTSNTEEVNGYPDDPNKIPIIRINSIKLNNEKNTVGTPYGGALSFEGSTSFPIEIIISGVILCPYFTYGVHSDEEWENELSKRPGPITIINNGNNYNTGLSNQIPNSYRMNDVSKFFRSVWQTSQTTAKDTHTGYDARPTNILEINFDTHSPHNKFAVAGPDGNFIQATNDWFNLMLDFDASQGNPWFLLHEINHHHQSEWGKTGGMDEFSTYVLAIFSMLKTSFLSESRTTTGGLGGPYAYYISPAQKFMDNDFTTGYGLYSNLMHFFGTDKFKSFVRADQQNLWFDRDVLGRRACEMLRASYVFGCNMKHFWNFHGYADSTMEKYGDYEVWDILEKMNLPPFHVVANIYQCGYIRDGEKFTTARPFRISPHEQEIDFVSSMRQNGDYANWGKWKYSGVHFEEGRESAWKLISEGKYLYTPKDIFWEIEEVIVDYLDTTTNKILQVIIQFQQYNNRFYTYNRYNKVDENMPFEDVYSKIKSIEPSNKSWISDILKIPDTSVRENYSWFSYSYGIIKVPQTKNYTFSMISWPQAAFFLSEAPLQLDYEKDKVHLINYLKDSSKSMNYKDGNISSPIYLESNKYYYFSLVSKVQTKKLSSTKIGYQTGDNTYENIPNAWIYYKKFTEKEIYENKYVPPFEEMHNLDVWGGTNLIPTKDTGVWEVYKHPNGDCIIHSNSGEGKTDKTTSINEVLTDSDDYTEFRVKWWSGNGPVEKFPMIFEIDMGKVTKFNSIKIGGTGNTNYYNMDCYMEIRLANSNLTTTKASESSLNDDASLIFKGQYKLTNPVIKFDKELSGRYMRIIFFNNSLKWKDKNAGKVSISSIEVGTSFKSKKVIPMTNTKLIKWGSNTKLIKSESKNNNDWTETRAGLYYNGKGYIGKKGCSVEITIPKGWSEVGLIGDYFSTMGIATVYIDGVKDGMIEGSLLQSFDKHQLKFCSKSHKTLLYLKRLSDSNKEHTLKIVVDSGEIILSGILCDEEPTPYPKVTFEEPKPMPSPTWVLLPGEYPPPSQTPSPIPTQVNPSQNISEDNVSTTTNTNDNNNNQGKGNNGSMNNMGAVAGAVIGVFAALAVASIIVLIFVVKKRKSEIEKNLVGSDDENAFNVSV